MGRHFSQATQHSKNTVGVLNNLLYRQKHLKEKAYSKLRAGVWHFSGKTMFGTYSRPASKYNGSFYTNK